MTTIDARLAARYADGTVPPVPAATHTAPAAALLDTMLDHRSVRNYLDTPLPAGTLELLVAAAQSAASSSNLQTWSVVAVEDPARKQRLAALANNQAHVARVPLFLVWLADLSRLDRVAARRGEASDANRFMELFLVSAIDAALAAQNATLAAESLGLRTVYIGAMRNKPLAVAEELGLPPRSFAMFGLCVGYEDPARPSGVKPRLPQSLVLHRERYTVRDDEAELIAAYDETMLGFQASQKMAASPWAQQSSARVRGAQSISGRHQLVEWIRARGFEIE